LLAGQPAAILAAIGLVAGAEQLARGSWRRPKLVAPITTSSPSRRTHMSCAVS